MTEQLIHYKFKCLDCHYTFTAAHPKRLFDSCDHCWLCGGRNYEKRVIEGGTPSSKEEREE